MVENISISRDYMMKLDEEVKNNKRKFISLYNDRFIKSLFYKNIILLKKFLIYILDLNLDPYNVELEILNNELPIDKYNERKKFTDYIVLLDNKYYINIEFNTCNYEEIKYKNLMYLSKIYSTIGKKGSKVKDIKERTVIQININANKNESNYYKDRNKDIEYKIMGTKLKDILIENLIIILIPLDKYEKLYYNGDISKKTVIKRFLYCDSYVKIYDTLCSVLTDEERNNCIKEVIKMNSNYMFYTDEEMKVIDEMQMEANRKLYIQEGVEQGIEKEKEETIKNMINGRFTFDQISLAINKPVKEIKKIASSLNLI